MKYLQELLCAFWSFRRYKQRYSTGSFQPQYLSDLATSTKIVPCVNNIALSPLAIERKLANLKTNKATGPDDISPKIVKEAGDALLTPLMFLYNMSLKDGYVSGRLRESILFLKRMTRLKSEIIAPYLFSVFRAKYLKPLLLIRSFTMRLLKID